MGTPIRWGDRRRVDRVHRERMRAIPLFAGLDDPEVDVLDGVLTEARVEAGQRVVRQDGVGREFAVVLEGLACVVREGVEVARLGPNTWFGEHALLARAPRSADVIALTPMRLLVAGPAEFARLLREIPVVADRVAASERERQGREEVGR